MRIGIDIGGTKAVVALIDADGHILKKETLPTGKDCSCRDIVAQIAGVARRLSNNLNDVEFVGVGVPGTVDLSGKAVLLAPNLGWENEAVAAHFEALTGVSPYLAQDTRAAAWGEARHGDMRDKQCLACITLGTGIGCGIVLNRHIWHGAMGTAGEIGHLPLVKGGRACACGRTGCMEAYASGTGMARIARERGICDTTEEVFLLAARQNAQALELIRESVDYVATASCALINLLSPDAVLFSGGLSKQHELFVAPIIERTRAWAYAHALREGLYIGPAFLGADAPVIGAAFLDESLPSNATHTI